MMKKRSLPALYKYRVGAVCGLLDFLFRRLFHRALFYAIFSRTERARQARVLEPCGALERIIEGG
jgi:hypothetical protein